MLSTGADSGQVINENTDLLYVENMHNTFKNIM